ncbi:hypothetical protein SAMN05444722_1272 [Rhodovulum sp. ES.010]|nr:hypothetical protein SAMN05444722_1272 [Rhodovulum sp. ES.010]
MAQFRVGFVPAISAAPTAWRNVGIRRFNAVAARQIHAAHLLFRVIRIVIWGAKRPDFLHSVLALATHLRALQHRDIPGALQSSFPSTTMVFRSAVSPAVPTIDREIETIVSVPRMVMSSVLRNNATTIARAHRPDRCWPWPRRAGGDGRARALPKGRAPALRRARRRRTRPPLRGLCGLRAFRRGPGSWTWPPASAAAAPLAPAAAARASRSRHRAARRCSCPRPSRFPRVRARN